MRRLNIGHSMNLLEIALMDSAQRLSTRLYLTVGISRTLRLSYKDKVPRTQVVELYIDQLSPSVTSFHCSDYFRPKNIRENVLSLSKK